MVDNYQCFFYCIIMKLTAKDITFTSVFTATACLAGLILKIAPATVPFSMLPLVAMLAGGVLGSKLGAISMTLYMILGLAGVPVFTNPPFGGLTYIFQPTFGFVIGFIFCAFVVGKISENNSRLSYAYNLLAMFLGLTALYITGLAYLYLMLHVYLGREIGFIELLTMGFLPFILFDLIKALIAVNLTRTLMKRINPKYK